MRSHIFCNALDNMEMSMQTSLQTCRRLSIHTGFDVKLDFCVHFISISLLITSNCTVKCLGPKCYFYAFIILVFLIPCITRDLYVFHADEEGGS